MAKSKSSAIRIRVRPEHKRIIARAAEERGETVTDLLTRAALREASRTLAGRDEPERELVEA